MTVIKLLQSSRMPAVLSVVILSGYASFSQDGGVATVSTLTQQRIGHPVSRVRSAGQKSANIVLVERLLKVPLASDPAVRITLLNNQELQPTFAELGVAEADYVQAGRMRNPGFSFDCLARGGNFEIGRRVSLDLAGLLT